MAVIAASCNLITAFSISQKETKHRIKYISNCSNGYRLHIPNILKIHYLRKLVQCLPPKPCLHFLFPSYVLHTPPISPFLIWSFTNIRRVSNITNVTLYEFYTSRILHVTNVTHNECYTPRSSKLCNFLSLWLTFFLLRSNMFLANLFTKTPIQCSFISLKNQVSNPHKRG